MRSETAAYFSQPFMNAVQFLLVAPESNWSMENWQLNDCVTIDSCKSNVRSENKWVRAFSPDRLLNRTASRRQPEHPVPCVQSPG